MKLYNFHASSTSYRTRIVLNLKGLDYEYIPIRLDKGEHLSESYGRINPMRGVPTLELDNGVRLYQSGAIIEYLEEVHPTPPLLPKDAPSRAHVRALADIVGSDLHPVNNLRIRNFVRDTYKQDAEGVAAWIGHWNKAGFSAIETMLRRRQATDKRLLLRFGTDDRGRVPDLARVQRAAVQDGYDALSGDHGGGRDLRRAQAVRRRASEQAARREGLDLERYARLVLGSPDRESGLDARDVLGRGQLLGDEGLKLRQVAGDAAQDEIHFARKHVAGAHLRPGADLVLERLEVGFGLAGEPDKGKGCHPEPESIRVEVGVIALDVAGLLERPHAAETGGCSDLHPLGQFDIRHAAIGLKLNQYLPIDCIELLSRHGVHLWLHDKGNAFCAIMLQWAT